MSCKDMQVIFCYYVSTDMCLKLFFYLELRTLKSLLTLSMKTAVSLASGGSLFKLTIAEIPETENSKVSCVSEW